MKHRSRRPNRYRRSLPTPPTRAQMRQRVSRLLHACQVEATREAQNPNGDPHHLANLCHHIRFFSEALEQLEELND
jgi:hypothetical protein